MSLACADANSKLVDVVTVADVDAEDHVDNSLLQIWELMFGPKAKLLFRLWTQGLVKISKLKFRQDFEAEVCSRYFFCIWFDRTAANLSLEGTVLVLKTRHFDIFWRSKRNESKFARVLEQNFFPSNSGYINLGCFLLGCLWLILSQLLQTRGWVTQVYLWLEVRKQGTFFGIL